MCGSAQTCPGRAALTMEESGTSSRIPWSSAVRCHLSANQKKRVGLHYRQSEKNDICCICCIWVSFNPATNENKASWNCARLIFRKFLSPEETVAAPEIFFCRCYGGARRFTEGAMKLGQSFSKCGPQTTGGPQVPRSGPRRRHF